MRLRVRSCQRQRRCRVLGELLTVPGGRLRDGRGELRPPAPGGHRPAQGLAAAPSLGLVAGGGILGWLASRIAVDRHLRSLRV